MWQIWKRKSKRTNTLIILAPITCFCKENWEWKIKHFNSTMLARCKKSNGTLLSKKQNSNMKTEGIHPIQLILCNLVIQGQRDNNTNSESLEIEKISWSKSLKLCKSKQGQPLIRKQLKTKNKSKEFHLRSWTKIISDLRTVRAFWESREGLRKKEPTCRPRIRSSPRKCRRSAQTKSLEERVYWRAQVPLKAETKVIAKVKVKGNRYRTMFLKGISSPSVRTQNTCSLSLLLRGEVLRRK